jgi:hypothetical protein
MTHLFVPPSSAKSGAHPALLAPAARPVTGVPVLGARERVVPLPWGRSLLQGAIGALGGAGAVVVAHRPWIPREGLGLTWLLLLPWAAAASSLIVVAWRLTRGHLLPFFGHHRATIRPGLWLGFALVSVLGLGFLLANDLFHDGPLEPYTLGGYAVTVVVALLGAAGVQRAGRRLPAISLRATASLWLLLGAFSVCQLDARVYPEAYHALHDGLTAVSLALAVTAALVWTRNQPTGVLARAAAIFAAAMGLVGSALPPAPGALVALVERPSVGRRLLLRARALLDRDHDGYSPYLGGGDCDDGDPEAYPFSPQRDCLGWLPGVAALPPAPAAAEECPPIAPPEVIVVLTIDAFRCGFGQSDRAELRDICPSLTARLDEARANLRTHVFYPATTPNMRVLLADHPRDTIGEGTDLLAEVKTAGYRVEVVGTHPHVHRQPTIQRSADAIDETLVKRALSPTGVTSPALTDRVMARLARQDAGSRLLLWAHYYDPHAPYVQEEGEHLRRDEITSYGAEVRRTDAAIGRLLASLDEGPRDVLVVITADHGEEFGEHGARNHGHSLHQAATEVPFLALRLGPRRGELPLGVPFSSHDVGRYVAAAALGRSFEPSTLAVGHLDDDGDRQISLVQGRWKFIHHVTHNLRELYDLDTDPDELHNRADATAVTERLGRAAAAFAPLLDPPGAPSPSDVH